MNKEHKANIAFCCPALQLIFTRLYYYYSCIRVDLTVAGVQNLLRRAVVVRQRVAGVAVLVEDVRVGDLLMQTVRHADVRLGRVEVGARRRTDDLRAQRAQNVHLHE